MLDLLNTQKSNVHKGMQNIFQQYLGQLRLSISKSKARKTVAKIGCQSQNCSENSHIVNLGSNTAPFTCDARLVEANCSKFQFDTFLKVYFTFISEHVDAKHSEK